MKCYICRRNLGEEAGWTWCNDCLDWGNKTLRELIEQGTLVAKNDGGRTVFILKKDMDIFDEIEEWRGAG